MRHRVLVIASAGPREGKTTTAANLAVALANINRKVLIIDGDIRSPRLHKIFDVDNSSGLTNLSNQPDIDDASIDAAIKKTSFSNLHILTSGPMVRGGVDLLFSTSMPRLIARFRDQFEMVLIDTPPMLSIPDARVLGCFSDAVVLIARAGRTSRSAVQAAYQRFAQDYTPVLGIVLNDWNVKSSPYNNYYVDYKITPVEQDDTSAAEASSRLH